MSRVGRKAVSGGMGHPRKAGGQHKKHEGERLTKVTVVHSDPETSCWEIPLLFELNPSPKFRGNVPRYIK